MMRLDNRSEALRDTVAELCRMDEPRRLLGGLFSGPAAVLVRPDGHVAWVGEGTVAGLDNALTTWFGAALPN